MSHSEDEFRQMTEHKEVSAWLSSMELDVSDAGKLFNLIDQGQRVLAAIGRVCSLFMKWHKTILFRTFVQLQMVLKLA